MLLMVLSWMIGWVRIISGMIKSHKKRICSPNPACRNLDCPWSAWCIKSEIYLYKKKKDLMDQVRRCCTIEPKNTKEINY